MQSVTVPTLTSLIVKSAAAAGYEPVEAGLGAWLCFKKPEPRFGPTGMLKFFIARSPFSEYKVWWESDGWREKPGGRVEYNSLVQTIEDIEIAIKNEERYVDALERHME